MTVSRRRDPETFVDAGPLKVCHAWRRGGDFSLLLVGDDWQRERLLAHLRPAGAPSLTPSTTVSDLTSHSTFGSTVDSLDDRARRSALAIPAADRIDPDFAA